MGLSVDLSQGLLSELSGQQFKSFHQIHGFLSISTWKETRSSLRTWLYDIRALKEELIHVDRSILTSA